MPADHLIVVFEPIEPINNKPARTTREIKIRPMKKSGIDLFRIWLNSQNWNEVLWEKSVHEKSSTFQQILLNKLDEFLPTKVRKISSDDQPFCNEKMKILNRAKSREYNKNRRSEKWKQLNLKYKKEVRKAKRSFYKDKIKDQATSGK